MLKSAFFKKLGTYHKAVYKPYSLWPTNPDAKYHLAIELACAAGKISTESLGLTTTHSSLDFYFYS